MTPSTPQSRWTTDEHGDFVDWLARGARRPDGTVVLTLPGEDWHALPQPVRMQRLVEYQKLLYRAQGFRMVEARHVDPETGTVRRYKRLERVIPD